jgi:hypothetical protein
MLSLLRNGAKSSKPLAAAIRLSSTSTPINVETHTAKDAPVPFASNFKSQWPAPFPEPLKEEIKPLPRTISDDKLHFEMRTTFSRGNSMFYPHMKMHPADLKVALQVKVDDLDLNALEKKIFIEMVGPRWNVGKRTVRLTMKRFYNRIENKKYLVYLLENLLHECREIAKIAHTIDSNIIK